MGMKGRRRLLRLCGAGDSTPPVPPYHDYYSMVFDGINESVDCGPNHAYNYTQAFWVSHWLRTPSVLSGDGASFGTCNASGNDGYYLLTRYASNDLIYQMVSSSGATYWEARAGAFGWTPDTWYHIVVYCPGDGVYTNIKLWVNGAPLAVAYGGAGNPSATAPLGRFHWGKLGSYGGYYFKGYLDECCVGVGVMDQAKIDLLYNGGSPPDSSAIAGVVSPYRMGDLDDDITMIKDRISSINGTPINMESGDIVAVVPP